MYCNSQVFYESDVSNAASNFISLTLSIVSKVLNSFVPYFLFLKFYSRLKAVDVGTYIGGNIQVEKGLLYDLLDCFRQCKVGCRFYNSGINFATKVDKIKGFFFIL